MLKSRYKFSIAFENASYKGYTTEKLITSMQADTIPVYWGNPNVGAEFNTKSFINCHDYKSFDDVIEKIKELDNDENAYKKMFAEPWLTPEQEAAAKARYKLFLKNFMHIFKQPKEDARRHSTGCWQNIYTNWHKQKSGFNAPQEKKYFGGLGKIIKSGKKLKYYFLGCRIYSKKLPV